MTLTTIEYCDYRGRLLTNHPILTDVGRYLQTIFLFIGPHFCFSKQKRFLRYGSKLINLRLKSHIKSLEKKIKKLACVDRFCSDHAYILLKDMWQTIDKNIRKTQITYLESVIADAMVFHRCCIPRNGIYVHAHCSNIDSTAVKVFCACCYYMNNIILEMCIVLYIL